MTTASWQDRVRARVAARGTPCFLPEDRPLVPPVLQAETRLRLRGVPVTVPALMRELTPAEAEALIVVGLPSYLTIFGNHQACHFSERSRTGCALLMTMLVALGYSYFITDGGRE